MPQLGEEKAVKGIIFKGSVSVISSIMADGRTYTEVVEGTLTREKVYCLYGSTSKILKKKLMSIKAK